MTVASFITGGSHYSIGEDCDSSCVHHTNSCMNSILGAIRLGGWDDG